MGSTLCPDCCPSRAPLSQVSPRMEELSARVSVQGNLEQVTERLETHLEGASRSLVPR